MPGSPGAVRLQIFLLAPVCVVDPAVQHQLARAAFEKELVLDPKAWTSMDGIRQVVGPMWREWCMRTGRTRAINDDKQLGIWLKAWGRDAIERTRPRPARVPGYRGVRPK